MAAAKPALFLAILLATAPAAQGAERAPVTVGLVCDLIAEEAQRFALPAAFLARLIWKESRFDAGAVSPAGAEGIAQFMPGTAAMRGLADAFDPFQAIAASAGYLADLRERFGNLALAAAAYNSGESRVARWITRGGFLPLETENYVLDILGAPADSFIGLAATAVEIPPLQEDTPFARACRALPATGADTVAMASVPVLPWGIQVAGHFRRDVAIRQWQRLRARHEDVLAGYDPVVSRIRSPRGRRGIYAVRIGAETRAAADRICADLRGSGGACIVMRNR